MLTVLTYPLPPTPHTTNRLSPQTKEGMSAVEQAQAAAPAPATTHKPEQFTQLAAAPSGAGGDAPAAPAPGCLPRFGAGAMRFASPRMYFAALTPRTKAALGEEDYIEALRTLREQFPESADADMVPFIRVCKVVIYFG